MSEYQCYEFLALDRRLTAQEMAELRSISTRAEITPTRFWNEYQWGDLKADPAKLLARYFDLHLYFANWGTRRLMFRLPATAADLDALGAYAPGGPVTLTTTSEHAVLDLWSEVDEPEDDWFEAGHLASSLTPAFEVGHPFARQLIPQKRLQAVLGDRLQALISGDRVKRRFGVTAKALVLGAQPPQRPGDDGVGWLVHRNSLPAPTATRPAAAQASARCSPAAPTRARRHDARRSAQRPPVFADRRRHIMTVMRYSMAVDRLRTIAQTCTRLASLWEDDPLVLGGYVFGELLEGSQRPERLQLAFAVDLPPDEVTWYTQPTPMAGFAATVGIDKYPCEWYSRPALWPVWNHRIRGPVRFWSLAGPDETALDALGDRRLGDLHRLVPAAAEEAEQLQAELAASLAHLQRVDAAYWERDWRHEHKGLGVYPEDHLWRATHGYLDLLAATRAAGST